MKAKNVIFALIAVVFALFAPAFAFAAESAGEVGGFLESLNAFFDAFPVWLAALTTIVTAATAITALTPTKSDDAIVNAILKVLNALAGNFGKNRNADE